MNRYLIKYHEVGTSPFFTDWVVDTLISANSEAEAISIFNREHANSSYKVTFISIYKEN